MIIEHLSAADHNLMDDPIMADKGLQSLENWQEAIAEVGEVILLAGLQDSLSMRLIHRHHTIDPGQLMVERAGEYKGSSALITEVRHEREVDMEGLLPNVLSVSENGFGVTEYCVPDIIADEKKARQALENTAVLTRVREVILRYGMEKYVGIGLCDKPFFKMGREDGILLEITDVDQHANVLRWLPKKDEEPKSIQTLWKFEDPKSVYNNAPLRAFCSWDNHGNPSCLVYCFVICEALTPGHAETHEKPHAPSEY